MQFTNHGNVGLARDFVTECAHLGVALWRVALIPAGRAGTGAGAASSSELKPRWYPAWSTHKLLGELSQLFTANRSGQYELYCRPVDPSWVLVDDVTPQAPSFYSAQFALETSAGNYQLWCRVPGVRTADDYRAAAHFLCVANHADPGAVRVNQVGRMPASINNKPGRGRFEVDLIYDGEPLFTDVDLPEARAMWLAHKAAGPKRKLDGAFHRESSNDSSRRDYAVLRRQLTARPPGLHGGVAGRPADGRRPGQSVFEAAR